MSQTHINIGSNQGDRAALIERAVALIAERLDPDSRAEIRLAPIVESEPWGYSSPHSYFNLGIMITTDDTPDPEALLQTLLQIQNEISDAPHRLADGTYTDRPIDIDLIAVDDLQVDNDRLTLPHPRMSQRPFVLQPMTHLAPTWHHPATNLTPSQMLANI